MNVNWQWCSQEKINSKQNSVVKKKDAYNDFVNKYLQKINDQRRKLLILHEEGIENYKAFKKLYINENNGLTLIDTSSEESMKHLEMNQGENK